MAKSFSIPDYVLFGLTLLISAAIGLFFSVKKKRNAEEVFTGGHHMPILPTALSLATSFLSGVLLLAMPVEIYKRGLYMWLAQTVGGTAACLLAIVVVMPIFFEFRPLSVYEYFEVRFGSRFLRKCGAVLYLLFMLSYMGVVLYAPSVALSGVTGVQPWVFFIVVGLVCNIYTSFGGLKAVVWTDTFQAVCMFGGLFTIIAKGLVDNGGFGRTYNISETHGRLELSNIHPNPFQYMNVWTASVGGSGFLFMLITFNQITVQRYFSVGSVGRAQTLLALTIPNYVILTTLAHGLGLLMFVYYLGCDPITSKQVAKSDQLVLFYVLDIVGEYPGVPGIFLACLFSGTLSTISSGINSMAAVFWEDIVKEHVPNTSDRARTIIITSIALFFGFLAMAVAGAAGPLGGILQTVLSVMGAIGGPICGLFMLGMFFPQANRHGATVGLFFAVFVTGFVAVGNVIWKPYARFALELPVDQCHDLNISTPQSEFLHLNGSNYPNLPGIRYLYTLSEIFFPTLSIMCVIIVGWPVSMVWKDRKSSISPVKGNEEKTGRKPRLCVTDFFGKDKASSVTHFGKGDDPSDRHASLPKGSNKVKDMGIRRSKVHESRF